MEGTQDTRSLPTVIIHTVILAATTVLSLSGNSLVWLAFYRNRRLRTITSFYVLSLAVANLMVATFVFPFRTVTSGLRRWPFSSNLCHFNSFLSLHWTMISLGTLALTSINRYFCIVKPQRYSIYFTRKKTFLSIAFIWVCLFVVSVAYNSKERTIYRWDPNRLFCKEYSHGVRTDRDKRASIGLACYCSLSTIFVFFGYGRVYRVVRQHNRAIVPSLQHAENSQGAIRIQEIKTSRVLFAASFGFFISWIRNYRCFVLSTCFWQIHSHHGTVDPCIDLFYLSVD